MKRWATAGIWVVVAAALLAGTACIEFQRVSSAPTSARELINSLTSGLYSGTGAVTADACGNFEWSITELTNSSAKGTFGATCPGPIRLTGSAEGTLNGTVVSYRAGGTAQTPIGNCPFTLTGTATLEGDGVRVAYTANTCAGTFTGSELLRKR